MTGLHVCGASGQSSGASGRWLSGAGASAIGHGVGASGRVLVRPDVFLAVVASLFDRWRSAVDVERGGRVVASSGLNTGLCVSGCPNQLVRSPRCQLPLEPNGSIRLGLYKKGLAGHGSLSWHFY